MNQLLQALRDLSGPLWDVLTALTQLALPWIPLVAWVAYWLFAVNWTKLREQNAKGGWIGITLLGIVAILVWGAIDPPVPGGYDLFGLRISHYVEKTVYVSGLICMAYLAGALQLSGFKPSCCGLDACEVAEEDHGHDDHGHGGHH